MQPIYHDKEQIIEVAGDEPICLRHIFECGQCFRWSPSPKGGYKGVAYGRPTRVWMEGGRLFMRSTAAEYETIWRPYFDLDQSYNTLTEGFCHNDFMRQAVEYGRGLRILQQDPWEALASFIISQCNNIPRIRSILDILCRLYGDAVELEGETLHAFPSPARIAALSLADLTPLRAGIQGTIHPAGGTGHRSGGVKSGSPALYEHKRGTANNPNPARRGAKGSRLLSVIRLAQAGRLPRRHLDEKGRCLLPGR